MTCPNDESLARWLDGESTVNDAEQLAAHVAGCASCGAKKAAMEATIAALHGGARTDDRFTGEVMQRIANDRGSRWRPTMWTVAGAAAVAAAALIVVARPDGELRERGGDVRDADRRGVRIYRGTDGRPLDATSVVATADGFRFEIVNRTKKAGWFMLFGIDAANEVHWFYPAWLDPAENPTSRRLEAAPEVTALEEGVTPQGVAPGPFTFVFLTSERPLDVKTVEASIDRLETLGTGVQRLRVVSR